MLAAIEVYGVSNQLISLASREDLQIQLWIEKFLVSNQLISLASREYLENPQLRRNYYGFPIN